MKTITMMFMVIYCLSTPKQFKGTVIDYKTKEKLAGVMVVVNNDTTYTDFDGYFLIENIDSIESINFNLTSYEKNEFILVNESVDSLSVRKNKIFITEK